MAYSKEFLELHNVLSFLSPLAVGPLNPAKGSGSTVSSPLSSGTKS